MQITNGLIDRWLEEEQRKIEQIYETTDHKKPPIYSSHKEALEAIIEGKDEQIKKNQLEGQRSKKLGAGDAASIIINKVAVTFIESSASSHALAVYDYDKKIYTFNTMTVLNDYIVAIMGVSSQSIINSVVTTLTGLREKGAVYNPLPQHKIAVGNGIFNCLTSQLEPFTPYYTVLTKIATNYIENAPRPKFADGFTLEGMIASLSNNDPDRIKLISQICKAILTEHSLKPGLFIILGSGGDGKSTFFTMIANIIGEENVAYVNFGEIESPDKMAETINKKLVLGLDNDVKVYLRKTALLKSIASHETITFSRKYMNAISVPFTGTFVQLCNEMPRMAESGSSMKRRLVSFKAENSHYERGTENDNVDTVYIKDKKFKEYALWYFLNEETTPYYKDFNDVDRDLINESLDAEDILSQFLSEMYQIGILVNSNEYLPSSHLYAAYQDWMEINNPGSKMLSARGFSLQITPKLKDYGYTPSSDHNLRPGSLEKNDLYQSSLWGDYKDRPHLDKAIMLNAPSKIFIKTGEMKSQSEIRRNSYQISPYQYFNIEARINAVLSQSEIKKYTNEKVVLDDIDPEPVDIIEDHEENIEDLAEEANDNDNIEYLSESKDEQIDDNNIKDDDDDENEDKHDDDDDDDDEDELDLSKPDKTIGDIIRDDNIDEDQLKDYQKYLSNQKLYLSQYGSKSERLDFTQELDLEYSSLRKLAFSTNDVMLLGLLNETSINISIFDYIEMFEKIINMCLNNINNEKDDNNDK